MDSNSSEKLQQYILNKLDLETAKLSPEYYYGGLPQCLIDAIFSISINYNTTREIVKRYCNHVNIERLREYGSGHPAIQAQHSIQDLLSVYETEGIDKMTEEVYRNKNRTSSRSGILKSEAVRRYAKILQEYDVNYFQDMGKLIGNEKFEEDVKRIPGQKSGISTNYLYMLAGQDDYIKPDRMILRFIMSAISKEVSISEAERLLKNVFERLTNQYENLTLRTLDHCIWSYERTH